MTTAGLIILGITFLAGFSIVFINIASSRKTWSNKNEDLLERALGSRAKLVDVETKELNAIEERKRQAHGKKIAQEKIATAEAKAANLQLNLGRGFDKNLRLMNLVASRAGIDVRFELTAKGRAFDAEFGSVQELINHRTHLVSTGEPTSSVDAELLGKVKLGLVSARWSPPRAFPSEGDQASPWKERAPA